MSKGIGPAEPICSPPHDAAHRGVARLEGSMDKFMMISKPYLNQFERRLILGWRVDSRHTEFHTNTYYPH